MMWIFPSKAMFLGLCYYGDGNFLYLVTFSSHCKTLKGNEIYIPWSKVITETLVATSDPSSSVLATYPYIRFVDYQFLVDYMNYMISNHIHPNGWLNFHLFFWLMPRFLLVMVEDFKLCLQNTSFFSKTHDFQFVTVKPCQQCDEPSTNWCRIRSMHSMTIDFFGQALFWSPLTRLGSAAQRRTAVPRQAGWCCCDGWPQIGFDIKNGPL